MKQHNPSFGRFFCSHFYLALCLSLTSVFLMSSCVSSPKPTLKKQVEDVAVSSGKKSMDNSPRKRIVLLPFLAKATIPDSLQQSARVELTREIHKSTDMILVDAKDLNLDFKKYIKNNEYETKEISEQAAKLGAHAVLEPKILDIRLQRKTDEVGVFRQMKTQFEVVARVRLFTARNNKEIFNVTKTVTVEESNVRVADSPENDRFFQNNPEVLENLVVDTFLEFVPQLQQSLEKLQWEGRVAMVTGDRIFLNVGRVSGLQIGDLLKVSEEGEEIFDPQTGNFLGKAPGRLKGTLEVVSYYGQDGAVCVVHSGAGFRENDRVELY